MSCAPCTAQAKHRRGVTFLRVGVVNVRDFDTPVTDMTGWTGACKIKTLAGGLVANVEFSWVDATQRIAQLRVDDTSQWPEGEVETDIVLTSPEGDTVGTDRERFTVEYGVT